MQERRGHAGHGEYGRVLARDDDVQIGAYARRQKRRRMVLAALALAAIAGAVWLFLVLRPVDAGVKGGQWYPVKGRCAECGYVAVIDVKAGQTFPLRCPRCKAREFGELWRCLECGREFERPTRPTPVTCPNCGSVHTGSAAVAAP